MILGKRTVNSGFFQPKTAQFKNKAMSKLVDLDNNAYESYRKILNDGGDFVKAPPSFLNGEAHFKIKPESSSLADQLSAPHYVAPPRKTGYHEEDAHWQPVKKIPAARVAQESHENLFSSAAADVSRQEVRRLLVSQSPASVIILRLLSPL